MSACGLCGRERHVTAKGRAYCPPCQQERTRQRRALRAAGLIGHALATPAERFWIKVAGAGVDTCWLWTGSKDRKGYGKFADGGRGRSASMAHRWAYEHLIGPIPAGLQLDHLCRTPSCVNPWHLDPVTSVVNALRSNQTPRSNRRERTATAA